MSWKKKKNKKQNLKQDDSLIQLKLRSWKPNKTNPKHEIEIDQIKFPSPNHLHKATQRNNLTYVLWSREIYLDFI